MSFPSLEHIQVGVTEFSLFCKYAGSCIHGHNNLGKHTHDTQARPAVLINCFNTLKKKKNQNKHCSLKPEIDVNQFLKTNWVIGELFTLRGPPGLCRHLPSPQTAGADGGHRAEQRLKQRGPHYHAKHNILQMWWETWLNDKLGLGKFQNMTTQAYRRGGWGQGQDSGKVSRLCTKNDGLGPK